MKIVWKYLAEVGKKISKANAAKLRRAWQEVSDILALVDEKSDVAEAERSQNERQKLLLKAVRDRVTKGAESDYSYWVWISDVFDTNLVYCVDGDKCYQCDYEIADDGTVTLGDPVEVIPHMTYDPVPVDAVQEAALQTDCVPLIEAGLQEAATANIKLIAPGWGSSGYYSKETLRKAAPVFAAGTKMFWNHQTAAEEAARPEGDLDQLAGELLEDATYNENGSAGPGLYARARVFDRYTAAVKDLKDSIGVSIRAYGRAETGEAEGRKGPLIKEITAAKSVDYVTIPGAGGKALELFESAGRVPVSQKENQMNEEQIKALIESGIKPIRDENAALRTENARLREGLAMTNAKEFAVKRLATINLPGPTRARLAESLAANPPLKDGALDFDAFTKAIDEAAKREAEYLQQLGGGFGVVTGMGITRQEPAEVKEADLVADFQALGMSESAAKIAAAGREAA